jgi:hypothetical protein
VVLVGLFPAWQELGFRLPDGGMNSKWLRIAAGVLVVGLGVWFWLGRTAGPRGANLAEPTSPATREPSPPANPPPNAIGQFLQSAGSALSAAKTAEERMSALALLREALASGSTNEATAAIRALLDSKADASTGQGFKVGGGGSLLEAPTLRTWLLEQLASLDPAAAAAYSRVILNGSDSPDEWAVALRNLARADTSAAARALLESKTTELLRNEAWQRDPSVGYLEAFDTAVHLGGTALLPPLTELVSRKDQAVAHAAFLTLDRLTINQPATTLAALAQHPEWMTGREETRANYFARADVGDGEQRRLVEAYLLDAARSPTELQTFAGVFPNANFMISHNLLTENKTLDGATLRQRDQAAIEAVNQWLGDPRFAALKQPLTTMQRRLAEFVRQADRP